MPQIIIGPQQHAPSIDGSVRGKAYSFLAKLAENDTLPGLHVEPIVHAVDPRVRTGRVDHFWRAVMFKVQGQSEDALYVYLGVWPHDEASDFAMRARLRVNPVNGIAELLSDSSTAPGTAAIDRDPLTQPGAAAAPLEPLLVALGHTAASLAEDLGLDPALVELAMGVTDPDELLTLAEVATSWQGVALIDLSAGKSVAQVRESLGIGQEEVEPQPDDPDDMLAKALHHPAARMQFAFVEDDAELRRAVEDADFAAWRIFLHPEQRKYAERPRNGPFRLSGGAGTGKTVVLLHRARHLARQSPGARILLTTFNKTLAEAMQRDLKVLDPTLPLASRLGEPGIFVRGVDAVAHAVRQTRQAEVPAAVEAVLGSRTSEVGAVTRRQAWRDAIASDGGDLPTELRSPAFLEAEYVTVLLPNRVTGFEAYAKVRRPGRGVALSRAGRAAVWRAVSAYRLVAAIHGSIDFAEASAIASEVLTLSGARPFDHVLVDEGQDLAPTHWQLLRALVAEGPDDLFIAEDSHQRIYGQKVVLGRYGIRIVGRSERLRLNYRTTAQNLRYAVSVLSGEDFVDLEDLPEDASDYRSARTGPVPQAVRAASLAEETQTAADLVGRWVSDGVAPETIGILVRTEQIGERFVRDLEERGVSVRFVQGKNATPGRPVVMTMHRAKGMEFSRVIVAGTSAEGLPAAYAVEGLSDADRADALRRERSLLYVATTRARDELVVLWTGEPSGLLPDLDRGTT